MFYRVFPSGSAHSNYTLWFFPHRPIHSFSSLYHHLRFNMCFLYLRNCYHFHHLLFCSFSPQSPTQQGLFPFTTTTTTISSCLHNRHLVNTTTTNMRLPSTSLPAQKVPFPFAACTVTFFFSITTVFQISPYPFINQKHLPLTITITTILSIASIFELVSFAGCRTVYQVVKCKKIIADNYQVFTKNNDTWVFISK